jgi:peptidoglycan/LPS O-acetylase OafA/YrhL
MGGIRHLTITRFFAALLVVAFHFGHNVPFLQDTWLKPLVGHGNLAVDYFFCLSGFIMAFVYVGPNSPPLNLKRFWIARFARIYPVYAVALAITALVANTNSHQIIASAFAVQAWYFGLATAPNGPGWSLSVEATFYALFPILAYLLRTFSMRAILGASMGLWLLTQIAALAILRHWQPVFPSPAFDLVYYSVPAHLNEFVTGALLGRLMACKLHAGERLRSSPEFRIMVILAVATVATRFVVDPVSDSLLRVEQDGWYIFVFAVLIGAVCHLPAAVQRLTGSAMAQALGEASYSLYILQLPVYLLFAKAVDAKRISGTSFFLLFVGVLIAVALASYFLFERPARQFIRTRLERLMTSRAANAFT